MPDNPRTKNKERRTWNHDEKTLRFLIVNQFVPPDPAPTARLLGEVAEELRRRGHEPILVGDRVDYRGGKTLLGSRALREVRSLLRLFLRLLAAPRADAIVCLSSPPMLPVVANLARVRHRGARLIHWAMDLYPDVAVALGEVRENSWLHRITRHLMRRVYRSCHLVVALDREMAQRIGVDPLRCEIAPPWPPPVPESVGRPDGATERSAFTWLYSGNLGRAHEWRTLLEAQARLEAEGIKVDLVFQGDGAEVPAAKALASSLGLKRCHWRPYASETDLVPSLLEADALLVTQKPETAGCLWPSKLALVLQTGRPVLWIGQTDGGIADRIRDSGHPVFSPGDSKGLAAQLARWARSLPRISPDPLAEVAQRVERVRETGIGRLADRLEGAPVAGRPGN